MQTFKEFVVNDIEEFPPAVLRLINRKCSSFLSHTTQPIVRGVSTASLHNSVSNSNKFFMMSPIRTDRIARDSGGDHTFNLYFNLAIEAIYGIPNIRSKSLFCSGDIAVSEFYGRTFFVFPTNGSKFVISPNVKDSFKDLKEIHTDVIRELKNFKDDSVIDIYNFMNGPESAAIFRERGNMSLSDFSELTSKDAGKVLSSALKNIFSHSYKYKPSNSLDSALSAGAEIMIHGAPNVFLINASKLREMLIKNPSLVPARHRQLFERGSPMLKNVYAAFIDMIKEAK